MRRTGRTRSTRRLADPGPGPARPFPEGYRYLAYLQVRVGYPVKPEIPGMRGPEVEWLYERGAAWLAGDPSPLAPQVQVHLGHVADVGDGPDRRGTVELRRPAVAEPLIGSDGIGHKAG